MIDRSRLSVTARIVAPFVLASVTCVSAAAGPSADGSFDRTLKVTGAVDLTIRSGSGQIRVRPGAGDTVKVVGRISADNSWFIGRDVTPQIRKLEQNPPIEQQGNVIRVGIVADEDLLSHLSISYDVTVPAQTKVDAKTGSGSLDIGDVAGPVGVSSGSGGIVVGRVSGPVTASAGSGSIEVAGGGSLDARTGSGSIRAAGIAGPATAKSGSGSLRIGLAGKGDVDVSAASGGVTLTGVNGAARVACSSGAISIEGRPSGAWSIHSSSGSVTLSLPADVSFDLDAHANSGHVESAHPVTMAGRLDERHLQGKVRGGGALIEVRSSSGGIRIQ